MCEEQVGFLFKIATSLKNSVNNRSSSLLQSYYLLQCKEITRGFGLPDKQFSPKVRCSNCCLEWKNGTVRKINPIKLSRKQQRRINALKVNDESVKRNDYVASRKELLNSKELEQVCSFCDHKSVMAVPNPVKGKTQKVDGFNEIVTTGRNNKKNELTANTNKKITKPEVGADKTLNENKNTVLVNVYSTTSNVFSLQNKNNTLKSTIKKPATVIKNNKKKKDRYAGLCQEAVLASAKLQEEKKNKNKINLFLKKST